MAESSFYVGYLPVPPKHARFLRVFIPVSLWVLVVINGAILFALRSPGDGIWNTTDTVTIAGRLTDVGVPILLTDKGEAILVVRDSKRGAFDGPTKQGSVEITGFLLERDGRRMLEITQEESDRIAARTVFERAYPLTPRTSPVVVRGEILDAKCYLGAMKPGDGKAHKACATLCIRGGIPAMVRIADAEGASILALVVGPGRTMFPGELMLRVADPIEFQGEMFRIGDLDVIAMIPGSIASTRVVE